MSVFSTYRCTLAFRHWLMGGRPNDPKAIEGWIAAGAFTGSKDDLLRDTLMGFLVQRGIPIPESATIDELKHIAEDVAAEKNTNVFLRAENGELLIEGRQIKAMVKESVSILWVGTKNAFGKIANPYSKNAKGWLAERVFVVEDFLPLGVAKPDGTFLFVGHTSGPQGPVASMTYIEYVNRPTITFHVKVLRDLITEEDWANVWEYAGENGLGAKRSQSWGRFDVTEWVKLPDGERVTVGQSIPAGMRELLLREVRPEEPVMAVVDGRFP